MYYRGYSIDDKISYDEDKKCINIGMYKVKQEKHNFVGIYKDGNLITHFNSWKRATKIAKILLDAHCNGYEVAKDYYNNY